jgi:C-terminal processing protease CtpA/Prc
MRGNDGGIKRRHGDYSFEYLPEAKTIYLQYNACRNMKEKSFKDFTAAVMGVAAAKPLQKFVVDLRFNGGGDSRVIGPLLDALKSLHHVKVYALVGRYTFSSAFMAAEDLQKRCHAVLVGEAMGQRPNSYGDIRPLRLPNSGLTAFYCTKYFRQAKGDPREIEPDVPVAVKAVDYFSGKDPVMEYVLLH